MAAPTTLRLVDPVEPDDALQPREIDLGDSDTAIVIDENGVARIENQDGSVRCV